MATFSTIQNLKLPDATDPFQRLDFIQNWNLLDASPGVFVCTNATRPTWGTNQRGRLIFMTDYKCLSYWDGSSWQDERTAVPVFANGAIFDANITKNATPIFNVVTFTTPRPCTLAVIMNAVLTCDSQKTQFASLRINLDGADVLMGGFSDTMRFIGNSNDANAEANQTITAIGVVNCGVGQHKLQGKISAGTYNTTISLHGLKTMAFMATYNSTQVM